ncbi:dextranase [Fusarium acutatum]|uniref:Dextranase n=1 Tax=Fusarium acutatum TaxID=78861 RepID=A0A8H4NN62_9HYPO|nr:dextranase [Fusarium acutatum]
MRGLAVAAGLFISLVGAAPSNHNAYDNRAHCGSDFCTWWHSEGEINTDSPVKPGNVRQSHQYTVQVSVADVNKFYDSFVYEAIPRNGNGRIYAPTDAPNSNTLGTDVDDGITIEPKMGLNMAWSQFEYSQDVDVKIKRRDGTALKANDVIVRPVSISYRLSQSEDGGLIIRVPKDSNGRRMSVEFNSDLYTFRSDGNQYVTSGGSVVGREPRNALAIFASPPLPSDKKPRMSASNTKTMKPGPINNGDWGAKPILYFPPGVYYMNQDQQGTSGKLGSNHIRLSPNTYWVYFAPGAYVKGAIEYSTKQHFYATGLGVLSGEHYVYQANAAKGYVAEKSDQYGLRMWWHNSINQGQKWTCQGPTVAAPPFNTMDFNGNSDITSEIVDYKQVGAYFFQTDGPAIYPNSVVHDIFYHVNDDGIKMYYSGVSVSRATVWKCHNDPIIQMGWDTRNLDNIKIDTLNVIHTRYYKSETVVPSAIIGASPFYMNGKSADPSKSISATISNIVCEGPCPGLLRITPLQSYKNFVIKNVAFPDGLQTNDIGIGQSIVPKQSGVTMNLEIDNWTVGDQKVTMQNFQSDKLGQLDIDGSYWGQWKIT